MLDISDASARLQRFAPFLAEAFDDVREAGRITESPLTEVPVFAQVLSQRYDVEAPARLLLKQDSHLPISGSIKARGGIYEVLFHAEQLAIRHGLLKEDDDYRVLAGDARAGALFLPAQHRGGIDG
ncbi:hypothetical protein [Paraburkholderia tropica]|uniref:hypothetical protein n=1 Tax=Paraburkholderia tropica TaxID=92647 RepID=UPI002AB02C36|nr:hypothetical protein [Paraburkholderia tropica]